MTDPGSWEAHVNGLIEDPVMDEQVFRFLAAFTQIREEILRERLIRLTEWVCRHPEQAAAILMDLAKH
jgi:hypothetical protein